MVRSMPEWGLLDDAGLKAIDRTARQLLATTGIQVGSGDPALLEKLQDAGLTVDGAGRTLYFEGECLDRLLATAPARFSLCGRDDRHDLVLGGNTVHFTNGGRVIRILDMTTGGYRPTLLRDIAHTATLVNQLEHIRFYIIACQACDLASDENYHLNDFYQAFAHTDKHVMGGCATRQDVEQVFALAAMLQGGEERLHQRPIFSIITNPISPLSISVDTLSILQYCAEKSIPVTCAPAPNAGSTGPATLAGTLVQMHAEALAGVGIIQAFAPGAKCLYGAVPTTMDLRRMNFSLGSVETAMLNGAAVQLAKHYRLPIYGTGGGTEAKRPDIQAGTEKSLANLLVAQAGADVIHLAAGMLDSANSISYEQYLLDNEIIGMVQRLLSGIVIDEATLAREVIDRVGPGGHYITEEHTVDHMMTEFFYPQLAVRTLFDVWEESGRPDMLSNAHERVAEILAAHRESTLDPNLVVRLKARFPALIA